MKKAELVKYSPEVAMEVCMLVAEGKTLSEVSRMEGMPSRSGIHSWRTLHPEFDRALTTARTISAEVFEEKALKVADELAGENDYTGTKVRALEVAMNQWRWSAARRDPHRYGSTVDTKIVVPIQINTSLDLGDGGGLSTAEHENVYEIKATVPVPVTEQEAGVAEPTPFDEALDVQEQELFPKKKVGRPTIASKRHKTTKGVRATIARRKQNAKAHPRVKELLGIKDDDNGTT